ncbi:DUF998 domain-containing protein [Nocardioides sp. GXQ0305]|uniref:DUF998 domain-containing protein n=1 Tax=Nocardioides sp. GXQ0305 TaxID=3423912 RepID=UPI003D7CEABD
MAQFAPGFETGSRAHRRRPCGTGCSLPARHPSVLYVVATDFVAAFQWNGYRRSEQMVSELFAVGSPGHEVLVSFSWLYIALTTAFGIGVWSSARGRRPVLWIVVLATALWREPHARSDRSAR